MKKLAVLFLSSVIGVFAQSTSQPSPRGGGGAGYSATSATYSAGTYYFATVGGAPASATQTTVQVLQAAPGTMSNLGVTLSPALGSGQTFTFTFYDGVTSEPVTCAVAASASTCSDTTHTFSYLAGDLLSIQGVLSSGSYTGTVAFVLGTGAVGIGPTGATGATGATGPTGPAGATGASGLLSGTLAAIPATCTAGVSLYQATDQPSTLQIYQCSSANTWTRAVYTQGSSTPASCSVGQVFFSTSATAGQNLYLCTATNTWTQVQGGSGSGSVVLTTGSGAPIANCAAPSGTNLALYSDTTNNDEWWCYATNSWKKVLSVTSTGPYLVTGGTGTAPSAPATSYVSCYMDSTLNTQVCLDPSGNAYQMVKETLLADLQKRTCDIIVGDASQSGSVSNAQLGPQKHGCKIQQSGTVLEVDIESDSGSPSVIVGRRRCTGWTSGTCSTESIGNLVSSAVAASSGYMGCSNATGTSGIDGATTCAGTLQTAYTALIPGDWLELVSGTATGTPKLVTVHITYQVQ